MIIIKRRQGSENKRIQISHDRALYIPLVAIFFPLDWCSLPRTVVTEIIPSKNS